MPMRAAASAEKVCLRSLFPQATFVGCGDIEVVSATDDSRRVQPGQVFVARCGGQVDGHEYLSEAVRRGASAAVVSRADAALGCPQCVVADTGAAWGRLCQALAGNEPRGVSLVGITGTNGKTTTSLLVRQILEASGLHCGLIGTLEYHDGVKGTAASLTTPDAETLALWLRRMRERGTGHAAMEVSSHALCQHRLEGLELEVAAVTNITRDHLDYHGTYEAYAAAKRRIFEYLADDGTAVVNVDDPASAECAPLGPRVIRYGLEPQADVRGELLESSLTGQRFRIFSGGDSVVVSTPLIGLHNVSNCLAAAGCGRHYGISLERIAAGIESLRSVPGRLEPVDCDERFQVFVDYAHTADALKRSLRALRPLVAGRLICVFGAGGNRDRGKRPLMARAVEDVADLAVVTSDNPRQENPQAIIQEIVQGFSHRDGIHIEADRRRAIRWALENAGCGDAVVIAGKGHEGYQIVGDARLEFDDRLVAREELSELRPWRPMSRRPGMAARFEAPTI